MMVTQDRFDGQDAYACDACGFHYAEQEDAAACEDYCETHNSCSSDITEQALERG